MALKRTNIYLDPSVLKDLQRIGKRRGMKVAATIRYALHDWVQMVRDQDLKMVGRKVELLQELENDEVKEMESENESEES